MSGRTNNKVGRSGCGSEHHGGAWKFEEIENKTS